MLHLRQGRNRDWKGSAGSWTLLMVSALEPEKTGKFHASVIGEALASSLLYIEL